MEERVTTLDEARRVIKELRDRHRAQSHQLLAWRRRVKVQEELVARLNREKTEQLKVLSSQLLLFEARLCRKQKNIQEQLTHRELVIFRQQHIIQQLQHRLLEAGLESKLDPIIDTSSTKLDLDSLNDSDSAVIMEESLDHVAMPQFRSADVKVIRSVSDAVEILRPAEPETNYSSTKRYNGFLRRPEVLETVYSVEEDGDGAGTCDLNSDVDCSTDDETSIKPEDSESLDPRKMMYGSFERLHQVNGEEDLSQVTYNRVMSNHRSVTKPKDVKYKRINKAKSKSLEELRGRLRNWVDKGNKLSLSLDQSYA